MKNKTIVDELELIVEKHRDLDAYMSIAIEAYNLGVSKSIETCEPYPTWDREEMNKLKIE